MEYMKQRCMTCSCGAVVLEENLLELNSGLLNAYYCPGGTTQDGRFQPPHYEVGRSTMDMTRLSSNEETDELTKKKEDASTCIWIAIISAFLILMFAMCMKKWTEYASHIYDK